MAAVRALNLQAAGLSDVGRRRRQNEDNYLVNESARLFMVADGMGGHDAGNEASRFVIEIVSKSLEQFRPSSIQSVDQASLDGEFTAEQCISSAINAANQRIFDENVVRGYDVGRGMGTTLAGVWMPNGTSRALIFHVGDSRVYLFRRGNLTQLTRDHTLYQRWLDSGSIGDAPKKNIVLRAVGPWNGVESEVAEHVLQKGDSVIVCSDGLTDMLSDERLRLVLDETSGESLQSACAAFIRDANERGGVDNITVVLANIQ